MTYTYNGDGHRMAKVQDGVMTTYTVAVLGLSQVLVETTGGDSIVYLYGHDLLGEEGTTWAWHLGDGLGSVRQLAESDGDIRLAQGYTPFGVPMWSGGSGTTGYGFTGERWEAYAQLLFLRARYYEPGTGRFVSKDPAPGYVQVPQSLHIYVYTWNRPTVLKDPSGRQVPPQKCPPGQICAGGTTGPHVVSMPLPTGPYLVQRPNRAGKSYLFPGELGYWPTWQMQHTEYCRMPLWQVLHYYLPEHLFIRSEFYPVPVAEPELPLAPGLQYQPEWGYRRVTVYEPHLFPELQLEVVGEYEEAYTKHGLGLGYSDVNVAGGFEVAPEYFGLWASPDFAYAEAEVQVGTNVILGTLYFEQPGWMVFAQSSWGVNVGTPVDRYLVAFEEDVEEAGGYERYGKERLPLGYEFGGVMMQAYNKWTLYANWRGKYYDPHRPNDPEWLMLRLEEIP